MSFFDSDSFAFDIISDETTDSSWGVFSFLPIALEDISLQPVPRQASNKRSHLEEPMKKRIKMSAERGSQIRCENIEISNALGKLPNLQSFLEVRFYFELQKKAMRDPKVRLVIEKPDRSGVLVDLTEFLAFQQKDAAQMLGLTEGALCVSWKKATGDRRWPHRAVKLIDAQIEHTICFRTQKLRVRLEKVHKLFKQRQKELAKAILPFSDISWLNPNYLWKGI